jgi:hypothetical protein
METWKKVCLAAIFYFLIGYINEFVAENQIYHNINNPPLFDRGHNLIPLLSKTLPNTGLILMLVYFIIRWGFHYPNSLINYMVIIGILFIGRVVLLSVTQLPPALPGCSTIKTGDKLHFRVFGKGWHECLDYMYSGHSLHCVLIALFTLFLSNSIIEKTLIILATLVELVFIIGSRMHYTSDVLVGTLISILVFFSWPGVGNVLKHIYNGGKYGELLKRRAVDVYE